MRERIRAFVLLGCVTAVVLAGSACSQETRLDLGTPRQVAEGVQYYALDQPGLLDVPGPVSIRLLRVDPNRADVQAVVANDRVMSLETVPAMAARTKAVAAVNGGFFSVKTGDPVALLAVGGELVSNTSLSRGAFGIVRLPDRPVRLIFDRVSAGLTVSYEAAGERRSATIDGVDTTRERGRLMLYTPRFGADSDTAGGGVEWQIDGTPPKVVAVRTNAGRTTIPRSGVVLSFGGTVLPTALEGLTVGQDVHFETAFQPVLGTLPDSWAEASDIVSGAGLLVFRGRLLGDWAEERLKDTFATDRHPRTMIGTSQSGVIWLVTVDGRNPQMSLGMTFAELQRLARDLNLYYALNLDGGGSTTMVVRDAVVNHPSDATGPRRVSDGLIVTSRR